MKRACQEIDMMCYLATEGSGPTAAAAIGAAALLAVVPLASPLVQIWLLARKSKEEIEATVRVKEPLQACTVLNCVEFLIPREIQQGSTWLGDNFLSDMSGWSHFQNLSISITRGGLLQRALYCTG